MDGRISTFIILFHVCILSLDPVSAVDIFMNELTQSQSDWSKSVHKKYSDIKRCQEKPCQGCGEKSNCLNWRQKKWNSLRQPRHCGCMFPAVCSLLVCMWVIATGGEGVLIIFVGRRLELSVHCEVAAVVLQKHVNLSTGRDLRRDAPLLVFNHTAPLYDVIFHSP